MTDSPAEAVKTQLCRANGGTCECQRGRCKLFGTIHNPVKVPGHPDHPGYLRAFPYKED